MSQDPSRTSWMSGTVAWHGRGPRGRSIHQPGGSGASVEVRDIRVPPESLSV